MLDAAVDCCFWPLYEVVDGRYHVNYDPNPPIPVERLARLQKRFAHLLEPDASQRLIEIQQQVDGRLGRSRWEVHVMSEKLVYDFGEQCDGGRELLGGKGLGLAEMTGLGLPVPDGFTVSTAACRQYLETRGGLTPELRTEIEEHLADLERRTGLRLGDPANRCSSLSARAGRSRCRG